MVACDTKPDEKIIANLDTLQAQWTSLNVLVDEFKAQFDGEYIVCKESFPFSDSTAGTASAAEAIARKVEIDTATSVIKDSTQFVNLALEIDSFSVNWTEKGVELENFKENYRNGEIEEDSVKSKIEEYTAIVNKAKENIQKWPGALQEAKNKCLSEEDLADAASDTISSASSMR